MCDIILEFLYSSINENFDILIYHLTDFSTYIENWIFYLPFLIILCDLLLYKSFWSRYGISTPSIPSGPGWEYDQRILWPFSDLALLWLRTIKKHLKHCNYDSVIKFELAGVGINTIILFFRNKTRKTSYTCHWRQCSGSQLAERLHHEVLLLVVKHFICFRYWTINFMCLRRVNSFLRYSWESRNVVCYVTEECNVKIELRMCL